MRFASAMAWYTFHLARGLRAHGHEVYLFAQKKSPLAEWAITEHIPGNYTQNFHTSNPLQLYQSIKALRNTIVDFAPDILNPHCPPGHAMLAIANRKKRPLVRTVAEPRSPKNNIINRFIHEQRTDGLIFTTASSLPRYHAVFNFERTLESTILPGLDLTLFPKVPQSSWRKELGIPDTALFAAIVARMSPEKGQEILIEALALLPEVTRKSLVVLLTGDDNSQRSAADLSQLANSKGVLESLRFAPRMSDIRPLLTEIDLGIITSVRSEAVCRIALEYMAYSKPVISSDINILPEIILNGVNGRCVSATNPHELASALQAAVNDRTELIAMGRRGNELLRSDFTLDKMTSDTLKFYREVAEYHGRVN